MDKETHRQRERERDMSHRLKGLPSSLIDYDVYVGLCRHDENGSKMERLPTGPRRESER